MCDARLDSLKMKLNIEKKTISYTHIHLGESRFKYHGKFGPSDIVR
jgi:hypothetical protein